MNHKEEVKLNRLEMKLETERQIVHMLLEGAGEWHDGKSKGNLVLKVFEGELLLCSVHKSSGYYDSYYMKLPGWKCIIPITDKDLKEVLDEGVKKVVEEKAKKKQEEYKKRQKESNVSYMDVFKRVSKYLAANGYIVSKPKDEVSEVTMKISSNILHWASVKDFLTAKLDGKHHANFGKEWNAPSIFMSVFCWSHKYYKLAYPSLRKLVDKLKVLGKMSEDTIVPVAMMDELDKLGIGAQGSESGRKQ